MPAFSADVEMVFNEHAFQLKAVELRLYSIVLELSAQDVRAFQLAATALSVGTSVLIKCVTTRAQGHSVLHEPHPAYLVSLARLNVATFHAVFPFNKLSAAEQRAFRELLRVVA